MGRIPQDVIDQVLAAHDIVEVVGRYLPLKVAGRAFKAHCPFHEEKTPSFTVNPDRQTFKCFGCGKGGNAIGFLIEHEGLTFPEAVRSLASERGIQVPDTRSRTPEEEGRFEAARRALSFAQAFFVHSLGTDEGREARAYLTQRGYDEEAQRGFGLGFAPPGWDRMIEAARRRSIPTRDLEAAGLVVPRKEQGHYDRFRGRVTFPIADLQGRVLTFGARALSPDDQPKYLNGPETDVFKKANVLYALDRARDGIRRSDQALLMEGYTDVLMCHLHGIDRAVAGMGTAFTPRQAALLKRFTERIVLVYDGDDAGRTAAERSLDLLLAEGLEVRVALLPEGRDVDEILLEEGAAAVEAIVAGALDLLDFKMNALAGRHDLASPRGRARAAEAIVASIVRVPSAVERDQLLTELAGRMGGDGTEMALRREAGRLLGEEDVRGRRAARRAEDAGERKPDRPIAQRVYERNEREAEEFLLSGYLFFPELRARITRAVGAEDFTVPVLRRIYNAALHMEEAGEKPDVRTLASRLADDPDAQAVLAGLTDDPTLEDRIPFQIDYLERRRREKRRAMEIVQGLGGATAGTQGPEPDESAGTERADGPGPWEQVG